MGLRIMVFHGRRLRIWRARFLRWGRNGEAETMSLAQEKKMLGDNADEIIKSNLTWADGLLNKALSLKMN